MWEWKQIESVSLAQTISSVIRAGCNTENGFRMEKKFFFF